MATDWYLTNTKYFSGYEKEEIEEAYGVFDEILSQSPEKYIVSVGGVNKDVIIQSTANYNERRILFKKDDLSWGDTITLENEQWLVVERPFFNKIHEKSHIKLCTNKMSFIKMTEGVYEYDRYGNKIWVVEPTETIVEFPCVVESISDLNTKTTTGEQINVPEGDMVLQISYTTDELIEYGNTFEMFNNIYRISGIDKSKVHNDKGILTVVVSRDVK